MGMKNLEDLERAFERGLSAWESNILVKNAQKMGQKTVREVKRETPFITGNLRRRWESHVEKKGGDLHIILSNDADYAAPVNNGHRIVIHGKTVGHKGGKHMLEKGIAAYQNTYMRDDLEQMVKDLNQAMKG